MPNHDRKKQKPMTQEAQKDLPVNKATAGEDVPIGLSEHPTSGVDFAPRTEPEIRPAVPMTTEKQPEGPEKAAEPEVESSDSKDEKIKRTSFDVNQTFFDGKRKNSLTGEYEDRPANKNLDADGYPEQKPQEVEVVTPSEPLIDVPQLNVQYPESVQNPPVPHPTFVQVPQEQVPQVAGLSGEDLQFLQDNKHIADGFRAREGGYIDSGSAHRMLSIIRHYEPGFDVNMACGECIVDMVKKLYNHWEGK